MLFRQSIDNHSVFTFAFVLSANQQKSPPPQKKSSTMKSTKKSDQKSDETTSDDSDRDVHEDKTVKKVGHKHALLVILLHSEIYFTFLILMQAYL